jgi:hypothetical protein
MFFTTASEPKPSSETSNIWGSENVSSLPAWGSSEPASTSSLESLIHRESSASSAAGNHSAYGVEFPNDVSWEAHPNVPVCKFYMSGRCTAGSACRFSHVIQPVSSMTEEYICGICSENVVLSGRKFGLLENCEDIFCLECLREWRNQKEKQDRANLRRCPLCRVESFVVIPSGTFLVGEEKLYEKDKYCQYLASIPCKNFSLGPGKCQFGTSCLYKHEGESRSLNEFVVIKGADGTRTKKATQLSDFLRL